MQDAFHLYVISFTVGAESGLAMVAAQDEKSAFQILKNSGSRHCDGYSLIQTRDIGMTANCHYGLLLESFVNAMEAYMAICQIAQTLQQGPAGLSAYDLAVQNGFRGTVEEWLLQLRGEQGNTGDKGDKGDNGDAAGFGTAIATVENTSGDPGCQVVLSGPNTAKNMAFVFSGIVGRKGEKGDKGNTGGKGDTGAQGPLGPPGISSPVYASVSGTTGIPSVDATLSNTTLSLAFSGLKGEQGNPGSSQDYPFELVNNLVDGGTSKALTAEQGKHLYDNCVLLGSVVANNVSIGD